MGCKKGEGTPNILEVFEEKQEDVYAMWFSYLDYQKIERSSDYGQISLSNLKFINTRRKNKQ